MSSERIIDGGKRKVTIYFKGAMLGGLRKQEAKLVRIHDNTGASERSVRGADVDFVKRGGRSTYQLGTMGTGCDFFVVVAGWNHPDPPSQWGASTPGGAPGVTVVEGRYRSQDPRWISEFFGEGGPGAALPQLARLQDRVLTLADELSPVAPIPYATETRTPAEAPEIKIVVPVSLPSPDRSAMLVDLYFKRVRPVKDGDNWKGPCFAVVSPSDVADVADAMNHMGSIVDKQEPADGGLVRLYSHGYWAHGF